MGLLDKFFGKSKEDGGPSEDRGDLPQFSAGSSVEVALPNGVLVYQDSLDRKAWSEGLLQAEGVPINPYLPVIESEFETRIRPLDEVIKRFHCLTVVGARGCGLSDDVVADMITALQLKGHFTPQESAYLANPTADEQVAVNMSWRNEAAWTLAWPWASSPVFADLTRSATWGF